MVGAIVAGLVGLIGVMTNTKQKAEELSAEITALNESLSQRTQDAMSLNGYITKVEELSKASKNTNEDIETFNALRSEIISAYPELASALQNEVTDVGELADAYDNLISTLQTYQAAK